MNVALSVTFEVVQGRPSSTFDERNHIHNLTTRSCYATTHGVILDDGTDIKHDIADYGLSLLHTLDRGNN